MASLTVLGRRGRLSPFRERLMPEGPSDTHRRLYPVPAPEAPAVDPTKAEMDVAMSAAPQRTVHSVGKWAAYVQLDWPAGVEQHPNIGRYLLRKLDRVCGIDYESESFGLTYALRGDLPEEAEADANELLVNILEWLGLGHTAVTNCALLPLETPAAESRPTTTSVW